MQMVKQRCICGCEEFVRAAGKECWNVLKCKRCGIEKIVLRGAKNVF
jgi:hypothetical protein